MTCKQATPQFASLVLVPCHMVHTNPQQNSQAQRTQSRSRCPGCLVTREQAKKHKEKKAKHNKVTTTATNKTTQRVLTTKAKQQTKSKQLTEAKAAEGNYQTPKKNTTPTQQDTETSAQTNEGKNKQVSTLPSRAPPPPPHHTQLVHTPPLGDVYFLYYLLLPQV